MLYRILQVLCLLSLLSESALALPKLEEPAPLPAEFDEIITIYPDNGNTSAVRRYWVAPSTARIKREGGKLVFGVIHSGVSGFDPDGVNALLNVTVQPFVDAPTLQKAKDLITKRDREAGAREVSFSYINPTETTCQLLVGGQFIDWNGKSKSVITGGTVEAGMPFQVKIKDSFDVRCLAQAGGENAAAFGALYTMKFNGVGNRIHFEVIAQFEQLLEHYKVHVQASAWFGAVKANAKAEWTDLKDSGFVRVVVHSGTQEEVDKYIEKFGAQTIINNLADQLAKRTGMFARTVKPSQLPDAPGGGGLFGWGVSVGGGFEKVTDKTEVKYEADLTFTRQHEIAFGMNFPVGGEELKSYVKNLTHTNKPYPTGDDFLQIIKQHGQCRKTNLKALQQMYNEGQITKEKWEKLQDVAIEQGCYVSYGRAMESFRAASVDGRRVPLELLLDFESH